MSYTDCEKHGAQVNRCKLCAREAGVAEERERIVALVKARIVRNESCAPSNEMMACVRDGRYILRQIETDETKGKL